MSTERKNTPKPEGQKNNSQKGVMSFEGFLALVPLYIEKTVAGYHEEMDDHTGSKQITMHNYTTDRKVIVKLSEPRIKLFCPSCNGERFFDVESWDVIAGQDIWGTLYFLYDCANCKSYNKRYIVTANKINNVLAKVKKIGEFPQFRPHVSNRVISLIEPDKELFDKGLLSETKGLGIGAFTYYRRVVDKQWKRLLNKIKEAAKKQEVPKEIIQLIEDAEKETQFGKAVDMLKDAIPKSLYIKTHNPITLLHDATSVGLHGLTDEQCLDTAGAIRIILSKLADNIHQTIKDDDQIKAALTKLHKKKDKKKSHQSKP